MFSANKSKARNSDTAFKGRIDLALAEHKALWEYRAKTLIERETILKYHFQSIAIIGAALGVFLAAASKDNKPTLEVIRPYKEELAFISLVVFIAGFFSLLKYQLEAEHGRELAKRANDVRDSLSKILGETELLFSKDLERDLNPVARIAEYGSAMICTLNSAVLGACMHFWCSDCSKVVVPGVAVLAAAFQCVVVYCVVTTRRSRSK